MRRSREWSDAEIDVLARAVVQAPSVHNTQPWTLELPAGEAVLRERDDCALPYHDPGGRDRAISCGAAIANLELGMRVVGRDVDVRLLPDAGRPDVVARLIGGDGYLPSATDMRRYSAIPRRRSYRQAFRRNPAPPHEVDQLVAVACDESVRVRVLRKRSDLLALADMIEYAAAALQHDRGYQRELAIWTNPDEASHRHGTGLARGAVPQTTLPWAGLARGGIALPDRDKLAQRLERETVLMFLTPDDDRLDHLRTGIVMERTWLTAVACGLAAAVQTQTLQLPEARKHLMKNLGLTEYPQLLMRVGLPGTQALPQSPRKHVADLLAQPDDHP